MRISTVILAGFAALLVVAHAVGGERSNLRRLSAAGLPDADELELRIVWHLFSWHLLLVPVALLVSGTGITLVQFVAIGLAGGGLLFCGFTARAGHRALLRHPQWIALIVLGALVAWSEG